MLVQVPLFLSGLKTGASRGKIHEVLHCHYQGQNIVQVVALDEAISLCVLMPKRWLAQMT